MSSLKLTFSALVSALAIAAFATESRAANWTGCHGGVAAGLSILAAEPEAGAGGMRLGTDGPQIGVAAGCDYQSDDRVAFGAFLGYDWKTFDADIDATALTFGGRAGFLLGGDRDTFAYGLVAYTNIEPSRRSSTSSDGLAYGGGLESVVYGHWTLKGEVRRIDYDTDIAGLDGTETTATVGIAYHFANSGRP
jgi:Outer membrane protein beta-barrel domain